MSETDVGGAPSAPRRRGRPRTPGAEERILTAALAEYGEHGWSGFTIDAVARRAGVGKSTVYLRWPDKDALLTDAVTSHSMELAGVDTGSFREDLHALTLNLLRYFHTDAGWAALRVTFDDASAARSLGQFVGAVGAVHDQQVQEICARAIARGEMSSEVWPGVVGETVYGAAIVNSLSMRLDGRSDDEAYLEQRAAWITAAVLDGVRG